MYCTPLFAYGEIKHVNGESFKHQLRRPTGQGMDALTTSVPIRPMRLTPELLYLEVGVGNESCY